MLDWIRRRLFPRPSRAMRRSARPRFRPRLEVLEDRTLPSTYTVDIATDTNPNGNGQPDPNDAMKGDLRYCVATAGTNDKIVFDPMVFKNPTTIDLNAALTINNKNLTIDGQKLDITISGNISGPNICRIFTITGTSTVEIDNLTMSSAKAASTDHNGDGGAIYDSAVALTLTNDDFFSNVASMSGGAVYTHGLAGQLMVTGCNFHGNITSA